MHQVLNLLDKWAHKGTARHQRQAVLPIEPQRMLTFEFIGDDSFGEASHTPSQVQPVSSCLGRTEACLSSVQLSDAHCLDEVDSHQSNNVVYLQRDARSRTDLHDGEERQVRKVRRYQNPKVRATAMLDASDLLSIRQSRQEAYSRFKPEQTASKQVSIEVLRQLGKRSSREEMLEKVKDACDKVSAEALINSPGRRPQTGPLRQSICIQIG